MEKRMSNGDVVEEFLRRKVKFRKGDSFVLPDVDQRHTVEEVRVVQEGSRWRLYLVMSSGCAVCGARFTYTKQVDQWRSRYQVTRCCDEHRYGWRTFRGAWLTSSEQIEREVIREAKPKKPKRPEFGTVEQVVVDAAKGLVLVYEHVNDRDVLRLAVERIEPPEKGRDTRRQRVVRAMRNVAERGAMPEEVARGFVLR